MSLVRASLKGGLGIALTRVAGAARTAALAWTMGGAADALILALRLPTQLREVVAEGTLGPALLRAATGLDDARRRKLVRSAMRLAALAALALAALSPLAVPALVRLTAGLPEGGSREALSLALWTWPTLGIGLITVVATSLLQIEGRYFAASVSYAIPSLAIVAAVAVARDVSTEATAVAFFAGVAVQTAASCWLARRALRRTPGSETPVSTTETPNHGDAELKALLRSFASGLLPAAAIPTMHLLVTALAARRGDGAVALVDYTVRLVELPTAVVCGGVAAALLPDLVRCAGDGDELGARWQRALELLLWTLAPLLAILAAAAPGVVELVLRHGRLTARDAAAISTLVPAFSAAYLLRGLTVILVPVFIACRRMRRLCAAQLAGPAALVAASALGPRDLTALPVAEAAAWAVVATLLLVMLSRLPLRLNLAALARTTLFVGVAFVAARPLRATLLAALMHEAATPRAWQTTLAAALGTAAAFAAAWAAERLLCRVAARPRRSARPSRPSRPSRIVCLAPLSGPAHGTQILSRSIVEALAAQDDAVAIDAAQAVHARDLGRLTPRKLAGAVRLYGRLWREARPGDRAYVNVAVKGYALWRDALAVALLRLRRADVTAHVHSTVRSPVSHAALSLVLRGRKVIGVNPSAVPRWSRARAVVLPSPAQESLPPPAHATLARRFHGRRLLFPSNPCRQKGWREAHRIYAALRELLPDVTLVVAGAILDAETARHIERAAHGDAGIVVMGPQPRAAMGAVFDEAAVVLFTSVPRTEGSPLVLVEAAMHALPVVGTPQNEPVLGDEPASGLEHDAASLDRTVSWLAALLTDEERYERAARAARRRFEGRPDLPRYLAHLRTVVLA